MYFAFIPLFIDVILYIIVILYIPQKKYYTIDHFQNFLLNYEKGYEDINNYTNIINELDMNLAKYSRINQAIFAFSIILLISSIVIIFVLIFIFNCYREEGKIKIYIFKISVIIINIIRLIVPIINWSLALVIIVKVNKIRKNEDKIGLTNEIKDGIIRVIILLSICFIYDIFELIFIFWYYSETNYQSIFIYNGNYVEKIDNELYQLKNKSNVYEHDKSKSSEISFKEKENEKIKNDNEKENEKEKENVKIKKLLQKKESYIYELTNKVNQKDKEINLLKQKNENQINEINSLKIENQNLQSENPYKLKKNEKLMTIIFISNDQHIHYSLICKNTQIFAYVEQELYTIFPEYKETENFFLLSGKAINRNKTIEENNIKFSDQIMICKIDDS